VAGSDIRVTATAPGVFVVEHDGRSDVVYVAGSSEAAWAFWNGTTFHVPAEPAGKARGRSGSPGRQRRGHVAQSLTAPMPATVINVLVAPGDAVKKGDTVVLLEAMKMELPVRAPADATVAAVHCRPGELVQPDATLVELE
jgi:biotin carboxyl carrier protein